MTERPDIDRATDRAVRDLMDVDARHGFRGRVFARLGDRPRTVRTWFVPAAAIAIALIVLAVLLPRRREPAAPAPDVTAAVRPTEPAAPPAIARRPPAVPDAATAPVSARPRVRVAAPVPDLAVAEVPTRTVVVPALAAPDPITVASIAPAPLDIPDLDALPLTTVDPIDIAPLPPPSGRH